MTKMVTMALPEELAIALAVIAVKDAPLKRWTVKAREILDSYVAMHKARGNVE